MPPQPKVTFEVLDGEPRELVIRVRVDAAPADTLIPIAKAPLAAYGLELKPVLRLIEEGKLPVAIVGRLRFTKLSCLLTLVEPVTPTAERDDLLDAVERRAARDAARVAREQEDDYARVVREEARRHERKNRR